MEINLTRELQQAHALLDLLPREKLKAVTTLLEVMTEALPCSSVDEDGLTPELASALKHAQPFLPRSADPELSTIDISLHNIRYRNLETGRRAY